jgi:predicted nucleic acid-binding Zn ribbon protein
MPIYEYRTESGRTFELLFRRAEDASDTATDPATGEVGSRIISGAGFAFKGSGFYLTDYGKNAHRGGGAPAKGADGDKGGKGESAGATGPAGGGGTGGDGGGSSGAAPAGGAAPASGGGSGSTTGGSGAGASGGSTSTGGGTGGKKAAE